MNSPVEILLSTFNGGQYLSMQLDSILQQDYPNWKLLVRDDGSSDGTTDILQTYAQKYPDKIIVKNDIEGNIGYAKSFLKLLNQSSADYVMFCDQDDYWNPSKISVMLAVMLKEEVYNPGIAHLVFSDLEVVDPGLKVKEPSFFKMIGYSAKRNARIFFLKNYVPGCNILFNRKLIEQAFKTDNIVQLHDYWLMLVCASVGRIKPISKPLMKYRMHDKNAIGFKVQKMSLLLFIKEVLKYGFSNNKYRQILYARNVEQVKNICKSLPNNVSEDAIVFAEINESNYIARKIRNAFSPYIAETSLLKQLTYITCF